jgi:hypothetical protein
VFWLRSERTPSLTLVRLAYRLRFPIVVCALSSRAVDVTVPRALNELMAYKPRPASRIRIPRYPAKIFARRVENIFRY